MTVVIGFIPNERTVMLLQDTQISYGGGLSFSQNIFKKIQPLNEQAVMGITGGVFEANSVVDVIRRNLNYETSGELREIVKQSYQLARKSILHDEYLQPFDFEHVQEVMTMEGIDKHLQQEIIHAYQSYHDFSLTTLLASNVSHPELYQVGSPGTGGLVNNVKMYEVAGSGFVLAAHMMGMQLEDYRWQESLSLAEGLDIMLRSGNASERHHGVGGPFELSYVERKEDGERHVVHVDMKKLNMTDYLLGLPVDTGVYNTCVRKTLDDEIDADALATYIKRHVPVGIEFDTYFGLS